MTVLEFEIVDVFAERPWGGNPLAVVLGARGLDVATMQAIAREFNFSETSFVLDERAGEGGWPVRIFTPRAEVPFAGHPTLGTADAVRRRYGVAADIPLELCLAVGSIPVAEVDGLAWMTQRPPRFGRRFSRDDIASVLGLPTDRVRGDLPVEAVSTGLEFLVVPLRDLAAVRACTVDRAAYREWEARTGLGSIFVVAAEAVEEGNGFHARMFADAFGVPEDPATGSANGCLAAYLSRHRVLGSPDVDTRVEQGYEIGRPSILHLSARAEGAGIRIRVGGRVREVAAGRLRVPDQ